MFLFSDRMRTSILKRTARLLGIDQFEKKVNELQRVSYEYCVPSVTVENTVMSVVDCNGNENHILRMHVFPATQLIANQSDEVFLRVGDKSKKLNFEQRLQLNQKKKKEEK